MLATLSRIVWYVAEGVVKGGPMAIAGPTGTTPDAHGRGLLALAHCKKLRLAMTMPPQQFRLLSVNCYLDHVRSITVHISRCSCSNKAQVWLRSSNYTPPWCHRRLVPPRSTPGALRVRVRAHVCLHLEFHCDRRIAHKCNQTDNDKGRM